MWQISFPTTREFLPIPLNNLLLQPLHDIFSVLIPFMVISIILSVASNLTSIIIVRNITLQNRNKVETNFIIIMSITCAVQLIGTIISLGTVNLAGTPIAATLALILPFVSDGLTLVQPWLLVCFSQVVGTSQTGLSMSASFRCGRRSKWGRRDRPLWPILPNWSWLVRPLTDHSVSFFSLSRHLLESVTLLICEGSVCFLIPYFFETFLIFHDIQIAVHFSDRVLIHFSLFSDRVSHFDFIHNFWKDNFNFLKQPYLFLFYFLYFYERGNMNHLSPSQSFGGRTFTEWSFDISLSEFEFSQFCLLFAACFIIPAMASVWISFLASLTYGIPSVFLYILTIYVIIKHRKTFSSSFFILYVFDGIMNLFTYLIGFFTRRLTSITCKDCLLAPFYLSIGNDSKWLL